MGAENRKKLVKNWHFMVEISVDYATSAIHQTPKEVSFV